MTSVAHAAGAPAASAAERVSELQARIHGMQRDRWDAGGRPVSGVLAGLLPDGILRTGVVYTVDNSTSLIMAVLAAATVDGGWGAVVGLPDFGAEAAIGFGIDLERIVLVPSPADQWLAVTAALVDVLPVVVVHPQRAVGDAEAARLAARLRQSGCTLIVAGTWPQGEAALRVTDTRWDGLGAGHGYLAGRDVTVHVSGRNGSGRRRSTLVHLPEVATPGEAAGPRLDSGRGGRARAGIRQRAQS
ncbi:hypothetical protein C3B61_05380 [Cryobacterium zongtaii]|uniref:Recombinase A n=1 Tax=Cryobacterium zongtaii TaxID=1259217 RepID=A0A2S3ZIG3_9MICO|nr:hypothetical protein C3B61_05380 [Cryobacterium zongtaii]